MNKNLIKISALLSDQQYHDGTTMGKQLKITRAAVWKAIKKLEQYGIPLQSVKGKGYLLADPLILLEDKKIKSLLLKSAIRLEILEKVASTNDYLKTLIAENNEMTACLAETQMEGKGRLNRQWHSPFGQNIYLSLLYPFQKDISELSGLSLVVGLAACNAIESICHLSKPLGIKWPNDIVAEQQKIAGILIEIQAESNGFCTAIIGIGVNVNMQTANKNEINQPWSTLRQLTGQTQDRNPLCAALINHIVNYLTLFAEHGFNHFIKEYSQRDVLLNQAVQLKSHQQTIKGIGAGLNQQGHLVLKLSNGSKQCYASGDTSLSVVAQI